MTRLRAAAATGAMIGLAFGVLGCGTEPSGPNPDSLKPQFIVEYGDTVCHSDASSCGLLSQGQKDAIKSSMNEYVRTDDPSCMYIKSQAVAALDQDRGNWFTEPGGGNTGWYGYWKKYYQSGQYNKVLGFNQYYLDRMSDWYYRQQMAATGIHEAAHDLGNDDATAVHWESTCIDW